MTLEQFLALASFAFVASITPGPNNLMLMASGANFGFARTIPHMFGISFGFMLMVFLIGVLLTQVFGAYPLVYQLLRVISGGYLLYLAWNIATAAPPDQDAAGGSPLTLLQAAMFQWVNPKAWTMAVTAISLFAPSRETGAVVLVTLIFGLVNFPCISVWAAMGTQVRRMLSNPGQLRVFNVVMALLLVGSMLPALLLDATPG